MAYNPNNPGYHPPGPSVTGVGIPINVGIPGVGSSSGVYGIKFPRSGGGGRGKGWAPPNEGKIQNANWKALNDYVSMFDMLSGGSGGGGGGGGGAAAALMAALNQNKALATQRYEANKGTLKSIYNTLDASLAGNPEMSQRRYDALRVQSNNAGSEIANQTIANQNAHDEQRRIALQSLGVTPDAAPSQENAATNEALARLAQNNATWSNLQGTLGSAQVGRDNLDINGANDAEVIANKALLNSYEDYMRQLDGQFLGASMSGGGGGGGGGSAPSISNPFRDQLNKLIFQKMLGQAGFGDSGQTDYSQYLPSVFAAFGNGLGGDGKPLSSAQIIANLGKSSNPQGAIGAYNQWIKGLK